MIIIDQVYISDEVVEEQFVCDLNRCMGRCCIEGDAGASLADDELEELQKAYPVVEGSIPEQSRQLVASRGLYWQHPEFGNVTPTLDDGLCAYALTNEKGLITCSFEKAYNEKKISWKKPLSCHLFPLKISESENADQEYVNYEPRDPLCSPACSLGAQMKVPVFRFVEEALIRKYGEDFYEVLCQIADRHYSSTDNNQAS